MPIGLIHFFVIPKSSLFFKASQYSQYRLKAAMLYIGQRCYYSYILIFGFLCISILLPIALSRRESGVKLKHRRPAIAEELHNNARKNGKTSTSSRDSGVKSRRAATEELHNNGRRSAKYRYKHESNGKKEAGFFDIFKDGKGEWDSEKLTGAAALVGTLATPLLQKFSQGTGGGGCGGGCGGGGGQGAFGMANNPAIGGGFFGGGAGTQYLHPVLQASLQNQLMSSAFGPRLPIMGHQQMAGPFNMPSQFYGLGNRMMAYGKK